MKYALLKLVGVTITLSLCQLQAQPMSELNCRGVMGNTPAVLVGNRQYAAYNRLGDGYVKFAGTVSAGGITGRILYEGYTQTGAFEGVIATPHGNLRIAVLDNTGGKMIIYSGKPTLGAPQTLGQFVCRWQ